LGRLAVTEERRNRVPRKGEHHVIDQKSGAKEDGDYLEESTQNIADHWITGLPCGKKRVS
jgi:hypothetical protein